MSTDSKYVWIRTQDGSPTLWSNEIGEPFRSVKGAFHESLIVFVKPAIEFAQKLAAEKKEIIVGEFGLGAGTNWIFFSSLAKHFQIPFKYYAIEKDMSAFQMALEKWKSESSFLEEKIQEHLKIVCKVSPTSLVPPTIYSSLEKFSEEMAAQKLLCDLWFHDPFGSGVNPEGYSEETLQKCSKSWGSPFLGLSYACNGSFQRALKSQHLETRVTELNSPPLKKEALQFFKV